MRNLLLLFAFLSCSFAGFSQIPTAGLVAFYPFNGNAHDESGNGNDGTLQGPVLTFDRCGIANRAYYFDGSDDFINLNSTFDYPRRTVNLWFYAETIDMISRHIYISDNPTLNNGFSQIKIMVTDGLKEIRSSTGVAGPVAEAHAIVEENEWHMVTLVADEDSARHYLDGILIGTFKNGTKTSDVGEASALLGTSRVFDRFYNGRIDDVRIYNRALGIDEIRLLYYVCDPVALDGLANVCPGTDSVKYSVQLMPGYTDYQWQYNGNNVSVEGNLNQAYLSFSAQATAGKLTVTVSGSGKETLTSSLDINLQSFLSAPGNITGVSGICPGEQVLSYDIDPISGADSYIWNYSGTGVVINDSSTHLVIDFPSDFTEGVLTVSAKNTCGTSGPSAGFALHKKDLPEAGNAITGQQEVCKNTGNVLYTTSAIEGAVAYGWNYSGDGVTILENALNASLFFFENASGGSLTVYGINECGAGSPSPKFPILVKNCTVTPDALHIPNAFSPNSDVTNDYFIIRGLPGNANLALYNRSGKKVFESVNYQNDWDGMDLDGNPLETGTYWYVLIVPGISEAYKGFIYLKR